MYQVASKLKLCLFRLVLAVDAHGCDQSELTSGNSLELVRMFYDIALHASLDPML